MRYLLPILVLLAVVVPSLGLIVVEVLVARTGPKLSFTNPSSAPVEAGSGKALSYVVLGDSTAAGQGTSSYSHGIAMKTLAFLAQNHHVTMVNLAVSGARTKDVLDHQVAQAASLKPDVVLLAVGANDVTHLTSLTKVEASLQGIIDTLVAANCRVKIVLTGSPAMGTVPRLTQPLRALAGVRVAQLNARFVAIAKTNELTFAPIAADTGPIFRRDRTLFAVDRFHPNDRGYAVWMPTLETALSTALQSQPPHC